MKRANSTRSSLAFALVLTVFGVTCGFTAPAPNANPKENVLFGTLSQVAEVTPIPDASSTPSTNPEATPVPAASPKASPSPTPETLKFNHTPGYVTKVYTKDA